jgi:predicted phosphodiesterase
MRILAFSDLHRNRDAARDIVVASQDADIVVGAGDFATQGVGLRDTVDLLRAVAVPTVLVAGTTNCGMPAGSAHPSTFCTGKPRS